MTVDHEQLAAWLRHERDLAARGVKREHERPAPTAATPPAKLLPIDWRLLDLLAAHQGPAGIYPTMTRLAGLAGVSRRYARERLAALESAGLVERVAVFERDDDPEWQRRGYRPSHPRRQTSNSYRLPEATKPSALRCKRHGAALVQLVPGRMYCPLCHQAEMNARGLGNYPPVPTPLGTEPAAAQRHSPSSTPRNSPDGAHPPVPPIEGVSGSSGECRHQGPSRSAILAMLTPLAPVRVLAEWPNDQPPPRSVRRWRTREEVAEARRARAPPGRQPVSRQREPRRSTDR